MLWTGNDDKSHGSCREQVETFDTVVAADGHCDWPLLLISEGLDAWGEGIIPCQTMILISSRNK